MELQSSGVTTPYKELVSSLERNTKAVRDILESNPAAMKLEEIQELLHEIRYAQKTIRNLQKIKKNMAIKNGNTTLL